MLSAGVKLSRSFFFLGIRSWTSIFCLAGALTLCFGATVPRPPYVFLTSSFTGSSAFSSVFADLRSTAGTAVRTLLNRLDSFFNCWAGVIPSADTTWAKSKSYSTEAAQRVFTGWRSAVSFLVSLSNLLCYYHVIAFT